VTASIYKITKIKKVSTKVILLSWLCGLGAFQALQFLARFEAHRFSRGDTDFFTGARIAADAGLAGLDAEDAEAAQFDALAAAQGGLEGFEHGLDGLFGLGAADVCLGHHGVNDVQLNQKDLPGAWADARRCGAGCQDVGRALH
jgi:hypothetical protein